MLIHKKQWKLNRMRSSRFLVLTSMFPRLNGQYTLDNIASCLFGIETNSLQNENVTLINHLKKFFTFSFANILVLVVCKSSGARTALHDFLDRSHFSTIGSILGQERLLDLSHRCSGLRQWHCESSLNSSSAASRKAT